MKRIAKFEKVSREQFKKDMFLNMGNIFKENGEINIGGETISCEELIDSIYDEIKLPKRATAYSAGYDFYSPISFAIPKPNKGGLVIPTGIRCKIENGWVMKIYPRSGQGFKYGIYLYNTTGIIDGDYYNADNEGHIMMKISARENSEDVIEAGIAFCQAIFSEFGITEDDDVTTVRTGGLGSTTGK